MKIAFVGLGQMGSAMAGNLIRAGHELTVYNRTPAKAQGLAAMGAVVASSPAEAARGCDAAITMLSDDDSVQEAVLGAGGIAEGLPASGLHIGSSTISTALARRLKGEHLKRGQRYVSAPVFGRPEAAEAKKLLVVPAGSPEDVEACRTIFESIGRQTFVAGTEPWQANALKLCGNFMIVSVIESFGEANATMRKAGVSPELFLEVMNALFASAVYANYGRIIATENFEPAGFALRLGLKDVRLVLQVAEECLSPMPIASLVRDHFLEAMALGYAESDWSRLSAIPARNSGL